MGRPLLQQILKTCWDSGKDGSNTFIGRAGQAVNCCHVAVIETRPMLSAAVRIRYGNGRRFKPQHTRSSQTGVRD